MSDGMVCLWAALSIGLSWLIIYGIGTYLGRRQQSRQAQRDQQQHDGYVFSMMQEKLKALEQAASATVQTKVCEDCGCLVEVSKAKQYPSVVQRVPLNKTAMELQMYGFNVGSAIGGCERVHEVWVCRHCDANRIQKAFKVEADQRAREDKIFEFGREAEREFQALHQAVAKSPKRGRPKKNKS